METEFKVGDKVRYKDQEEYGNDVNTIKRLELPRVFYEEGGFDDISDLELINSRVPHYNSTFITALNVIDDWNLDFYLGNTIKYIQRYEKKSTPVEDLKKALDYLQRKITKLENESKSRRGGKVINSLS